MEKSWLAFLPLALPSWRICELLTPFHKGRWKLSIYWPTSGANFLPGKIKKSEKCEKEAPPLLHVRARTEMGAFDSQAPTGGGGHCQRGRGASCQMWTLNKSFFLQGWAVSRLELIKLASRSPSLCPLPLLSEPSGSFSLKEGMGRRPGIS